MALQIVLGTDSEFSLDVLQRNRGGLPETKIAARERAREIVLDTKSPQFVPAFKIAERDLHDPLSGKIIERFQNMPRRPHSLKSQFQRFPLVLFSTNEFAKFPLIDARLRPLTRRLNNPMKRPGLPHPLSRPHNPGCPHLPRRERHQDSE